MSSAETYQRIIERKRGEKSQLIKKQVGENKKEAECQKKISQIRHSLQRTSSSSMRQSKQRQLEREESKLGGIKKKIGELGTAISKKEKEIAEQEKKLHKEKEKVEKEREKRAEATMRRVMSTQEEMRKSLLKLQNLPDEITVLFMASNPIDTSRLRLDEEVRSIQEMIRKSAHRDSIRFETRLAVRPLDILQAINEINPTIVHFSGHGSDTEELVLQNADGFQHLVSKEAIVQTMATSSKKIRLVFFNSCFSNTQAQAVTEQVEAAIGMNSAIGDEAARVFAAQFYSGIGFGLPLEKAFGQAKSALLLENIPENNTPELYLQEGLEAAELIIVKPAEIE